MKGLRRDRAMQATGARFLDAPAMHGLTAPPGRAAGQGREAGLAREVDRRAAIGLRRGAIRRLHRELGLAERLGGHDPRRNAGLDQLGRHGVRAALRELHVVVRRTRGVGVAGHGDAAQLAILDVLDDALIVFSALGLSSARSKSKYTTPRSGSGSAGGAAGSITATSATTSASGQSSVTLVQHRRHRRSSP